MIKTITVTTLAVGIVEHKIIILRRRIGFSQSSLASAIAASVIATWRPSISQWYKFLVMANNGVRTNHSINPNAIQLHLRGLPRRFTTSVSFSSLVWFANCSISYKWSRVFMVVLSKYSILLFLRSRMVKWLRCNISNVIFAKALFERSRYLSLLFPVKHPLGKCVRPLFAKFSASKFVLLLNRTEKVSLNELHLESVLLAKSNLVILFMFVRTWRPMVSIEFEDKSK